MDRVSLVGLMKMELPGGDVLLCDGGFIEYDGDTYRSADPVFGHIASIESPSEGVGDEVPALEVVFGPPGASEPADLSQPGWQTSRVRFWVGEYDPDAGTLDGTPDLVFDGMLDRTQLSVGRADRELAVSVVSRAERLFELNIGNSLTDRWHQSVWAGELGHVNATGLTIRVAWGAPTPPGAPTVSGVGTPATGPTGGSTYTGGGLGGYDSWDPAMGAPAGLSW